jgi:hypothetical protein
MMPVPALLLVTLLGAAASSAQEAPRTAPAKASDCPAAAQTAQRHLLGLWHAQVQGWPRGATLLFEPHPDLSESVLGEIDRDGERTAVAGDVGDGDFTLEESRNGVNISATWLGDVVEGSCGREIRGTWQAEGDKTWRPFVMHKLGPP